jgi:hypothetical protein
MQPTMLWIGSVVVVTAFAGCSGAGGQLADLVAVTGTVTLDGQPLSYGTVAFVPVDQTSGQVATGDIKEGKFTMVTSASSPGVVYGDYKVRIVSVEQQAAGSVAADFTPDPNAPPKEPKSLIPKKYGDINESGLEVSVQTGMEPIQFELKSSEK